MSYISTTAINSIPTLILIDLATFSQGIVPLSLFCNFQGSLTSSCMHGLVSISRTTFPTFPIHRACIPRIWILETVILPVHVGFYCSVEVLFYLVNLRSFYYYFWPGIQWLDRFKAAQSPLGPC